MNSPTPSPELIDRDSLVESVQFQFSIAAREYTFELDVRPMVDDAVSVAHSYMRKFQLPCYVESSLVLFLTNYIRSRLQVICINIYISKYPSIYLIFIYNVPAINSY